MEITILSSMGRATLQHMKYGAHTEDWHLSVIPIITLMILRLKKNSNC
jgi:hypothetical protein